MSASARVAVLRPWGGADLRLSRAVTGGQDCGLMLIGVPDECEHNHGYRHRQCDKQPASDPWSRRKCGSRIVHSLTIGPLPGVMWRCSTAKAGLSNYQGRTCIRLDQELAGRLGRDDARLPVQQGQNQPAGRSAANSLSNHSLTGRELIARPVQLWLRRRGRARDTMVVRARDASVAGDRWAPVLALERAVVDGRSGEHLSRLSTRANEQSRNARPPRPI